MNRGLALFMLRRDEEAQKDFAKCLLLEPDLEAELKERKTIADNLRRMKR
jgi:hypothetical protein